MSEENKSGAGGIIAALLIGGAIGAALGILFAPAPGKVTRQKLNDWMDDEIEKGKEKLAKVGEELKHRKDQLMSAMHKES